METLQYQLQEGKLNSVYDKIYNCRVIQPTYEINGLYSNKFMLDKRLGTKRIDALYKPGFTFTDVVKIKGEKYYLANDGSKAYLYHQDGTQITSGIDIDETSPVRMVTTKGAGGSIITNGTFTEASLVLDSTTGTEDGGAYVKIKVPGCTIGQYIVFNDGLLKGATNRIEYIDGDYIYIIGTNTRGTLPEVGQAYTVYETFSETITVGGINGAYLYNLNGNDLITETLIAPIVVFDMSVFNGQLMVLSDRGIWYSKSTFDGNTNIYPRDLLKGYTWKALINLGTSLLAIGDRSKSELIKDIRGVDGSLGFVAHQLELTSEMFNKYSYVYKDGIFLMLTRDKRLPTVDIQNINNTLSKTVLDYADSMFRGLFTDSGDESFVNEDGTFVHFISHIGGKSRIYELDFEYKHWIIQDYDFLIYKKEDGEILGTDGVYEIAGYDDLGIEYSQEINFSSGDTLEVYQPYKYIRTIIGMSEEKIDIQLDIELELGAKIKHITKQYKNYEFDKSDAAGISELIGYEKSEIYGGTIASLQQPILLSARYARYKYTSKTRFILGESLVFFEKQESKLNNERVGN